MKRQSFNSQATTGLIQTVDAAVMPLKYSVTSLMVWPRPVLHQRRRAPPGDPGPEIPSGSVPSQEGSRYINARCRCSLINQLLAYQILGGVWRGGASAPKRLNMK